MQAFACFSNALALQPQHADTLMAAGALYKSCGLLPEALQSLEAALEVKPKDQAIKQALAVVLTDLGGSQESLQGICSWQRVKPAVVNDIARCLRLHSRTLLSYSSLAGCSPPLAQAGTY